MNNTNISQHIDNIQNFLQATGRIEGSSPQETWQGLRNMVFLSKTNQAQWDSSVAENESLDNKFMSDFDRALAQDKEIANQWRYSSDPHDIAMVKQIDRTVALAEKMIDSIRELKTIPSPDGKGSMLDHLYNADHCEISEQEQSNPRQYSASVSGLHEQINHDNHDFDPSYLKSVSGLHKHQGSSIELSEGTVQDSDDIDNITNYALKGASTAPKLGECFSLAHDNAEIPNLPAKQDAPEITQTQTYKP